MKNPISTHKKHRQKFDEIFGKIAKFFSSGNKDSESKVNKTNDANSAARKSYLDNIERYRAGKPLIKKGTEKIDVENPEKTTEKNQKKEVPSDTEKDFTISVLSPFGISINGNDIQDFSNLFVENIGNGQGMGSFRRILHKDFMNYDIKKDIYGISWLFSPNASYDAESISGKLLANKLNQSINFTGNWMTGKFYGKMAGTNISLPSSKPDKKSILDKFENLQNLIKKTIHKFEDLDVENFSDEMLKIKNYLDTMQQIGFGGKKYVSSNELKRIKSMIDQNFDENEIMDEMKELFSYFKSIESKIDGFSKQIKKTGTSSTPSPTGKKAKKLKF